jgi:hypothetical protein
LGLAPINLKTVTQIMQKPHAAQNNQAWGKPEKAAEWKKK